MILVDFSQIIFITAFSKFRDGEFKGRMARDGVVSFLLTLERRFRHAYGEMILCCDRDPSWRRALFQGYKYKRRNKRSGDPRMQALDEFRRTMEDELRSFGPWRIVGTKWAEGDDVIGTLVTTFASKRTPTAILSADRDFVQLHRFPGVVQYDPKTSQPVTPREDDMLFEKIMYGDARDGVPNILTDEMVFVEGRTQERLRAHLRRSWGDVACANDIYRVAPQHYARFRRNEILIDLTRTPQYIRNKILKDFAMPPGADRLVEYVRTHRLRDTHEQLGARRGSQTQGSVQEASVPNHRRSLPAQRAA
jgi:hypothetical protein